METLVFGLIAKKGAGKTTFVEVARRIFHKKNTSVISTGDILGLRLNELGREVTDGNKQDLYSELKLKLGSDFLAQEVKRHVTENIGKYRCILWDGVRLPHDVEVMEELGGVLVYIVASPEKRYERRKRRRGKYKGEENLTWEEFKKEDKKETERMIEKIGVVHGLHTFVNNKTLKEFEGQVRELLGSYNLKG